MSDPIRSGEKLATFSMRLLSTGVFGSTLPKVEIAAQRLLPYYVKGSTSNSGYWLDPKSPIVRTRTNGATAAGGKTLLCHEFDEATILSASDENPSFVGVGATASARFYAGEPVDLLDGDGNLRQRTTIGKVDTSTGDIYLSEDHGILTTVADDVWKIRQAITENWSFVIPDKPSLKNFVVGQEVKWGAGGADQGRGYVTSIDDDTKTIVIRRKLNSDTAPAATMTLSPLSGAAVRVYDIVLTSITAASGASGYDFAVPAPDVDTQWTWEIYYPTTSGFGYAAIGLWSTPNMSVQVYDSYDPPAVGALIRHRMGTELTNSPESASHNHTSGTVQSVTAYTIAPVTITSATAVYSEVKSGPVTFAKNDPVRIEKPDGSFFSTTLTADFGSASTNRLDFADAIPAGGISDEAVVEFDRSGFRNNSPAWAFAAVLRSAGQARKIADRFIDGDTLADWAAMCADPKGDSLATHPALEFSSVIDFRGSTHELLEKIASAGRATPHTKNGLISVLFDRPRASETPVAMFTPRNIVAGSYQSTFAFNESAHAHRVKFVSATGAQSEFIIYGSGYSETGSESDKTKATVYDSLHCYGISTYAQAFAYAVYIIAQARRRREVVEFEVDAEALVVERGDLCLIASDLEFTALAFSRVKEINALSARTFAVSDFKGWHPNATTTWNKDTNVSVLDSGKTLVVNGDTMVIDLSNPFTVTSSSTVIDFEFKMELEDEFTWIGVGWNWSAHSSLANQYFSEYEYLRIWGTQDSNPEPFSIPQPYDDASPGQWVRYRWEVGSVLSSASSHTFGSTSTALFFGNDDDDNTNGVSYFRNVKIIDSVETVTLDENLTFEQGTAYTLQSRQNTTNNVPTYALDNPSTGADVTTKTVTISSSARPLPGAGPQAGNLVAFGSSTVTPRRMIVSRVNMNANLGARIAVVNEAPEIFSTDLADMSLDAIPAAPALQEYSPTTAPKAPTILSLGITFDDDVALEVSGADFDRVDVGMFEAQFAKNGPGFVWSEPVLVPKSGVKTRIVKPIGQILGVNQYQNVQVRVRAHRAAAAGSVSNWSTSSVSGQTGRINELSDVEITSLQVDGQGVETVFVTNSPRVTFEASLVPDPDFPVGDFGGYPDPRNPNVVTSWNPETHGGTIDPMASVLVLNTSTGQVLREGSGRVGLGSADGYVYTFAENMQDGGPFRNLTFRVTPRMYGESGVYREIEVTNPPPIAPRIETINQAEGGSMAISFKPGHGYADDHAGVNVYASRTSGFSIAESNLIYSGIATGILTMPALEAGTWFFKCAEIDSMWISRADQHLILNASEEYQFQVIPGSRVADILVGDLTNLFPDPVFNYSGQFSAIELDDVVTLISEGYDSDQKPVAQTNIGGTGYYDRNPNLKTGLQGWSVTPAVGGVSPKAGLFMLAWNQADHKLDRTLTTTTALAAPKIERLSSAFGSWTSKISDETSVISVRPGDTFSVSFFANRNADLSFSGSSLQAAQQFIFQSGLMFWDGEGNQITKASGPSGTDDYLSEPPSNSSGELAYLWPLPAEFPADTWTEFEIEIRVPTTAWYTKLGAGYTSTTISRAAFWFQIDSNLIAHVNSANFTGNPNGSQRLFVDQVEVQRQTSRRHLVTSSVSTQKVAVSAITDRASASESSTVALGYLPKLVRSVSVTNSDSASRPLDLTWTGSTQKTNESSSSAPRQTFKVDRVGVETTTSAAAAGGATAIVVASATGFAAGQKIAYEGDNGFEYREVASVSSTTINLTSAITAGAKSGGAVWTVAADVLSDAGDFVQIGPFSGLNIPLSFSFAVTDQTAPSGANVYKFLAVPISGSTSQTSQINTGTAYNLTLVKR